MPGEQLGADNIPEGESVCSDRMPGTLTSLRTEASERNLASEPVSRRDLSLESHWRGVLSPFTIDVIGREYGRIIEAQTGDARYKGGWNTHLPLPKW